MSTDTKFHFKARKINGELTQGEISAVSSKDASDQISKLGLIPIEIKSIGGASGLKDLKNLTFTDLKNMMTQVPKNELLAFTQQLHIIISVGAPLIDGLKLIDKTTEHPLLKKALIDISNQLAEGSTLAHAMDKHPKVFNSVYVHMINIGEESGKLETVLERLYSIIESETDNRNKVKAALFYPKMVFAMIGIVVVVMMNFIVPKVSLFYEKLGAGSLPLPTRMVIATSDFFTNNFFILIFIFVASYFAFNKWVKTEKGRLMWDSFKLKIPVLGPLLIEIEMNSFCIILQMLILSGLSIVRSLEILQGTLSNKIVINDVDNCRKHLLTGGKIGEALEKSRTFPPILTGLIAIGEEGGSLESVLEKSARHYKMRIEYKLNNLAKAIEPFLLVVIFGIVLTLALAVFLPIWNLSSAIKRGG